MVEARQGGPPEGARLSGPAAGPLANAADVVLPGAAWVEKDGCFTNRPRHGAGGVEGAGHAWRGDEDWQILATSVAAALGLPFSYESPAAVRADLAAALASQPAYAGIGARTFNRPVSAARDLAGSRIPPNAAGNGGCQYQNLPPVKGRNVTMEHAAKPSVIPLRLVTELGPAGGTEPATRP